MNKQTYMTAKKENVPSNHKLTAECFTKCTKWKLNATLTVNKTSTGLIFQGKGLFFKKLNTCILNNFQIIDNISEITKTTLKNIEDKALHPDNNTSDESLDYSMFKFPLNNGDYNYLMTDCIIGDNLSNIVFLEFDLNANGISRDHLKTLREINNDFVDKEIHFVLNGTIHGKPVLKNELRFNVEARKFIKSMQFRLDGYKNEFIEKQRSIQRSNPNFEIKNSKFNFFCKIISNQNIGIEFHKPNFENVETYPTNFNSIVNSNITIDKLFFEISIPSQVINEAYAGNSKNNYPYSSPTKNYIYKETHSKYNYDKSLIKSYSNFTNMTVKQPRTGSEYTHYPMSGYLEMEKSNSSTNVRNYSYRNNKHTNGEISIYENGSGNFNPNRSCNSYNYPKKKYSNKYGQFYERDLNGNSKYETVSRKHPSSSNVNGHTYYEDMNNYPNINGNANAPNSHLNSSLGSKNNKHYSLQILLTHYEGMCNFIIFAKSCTPYVHKKDTHLIDDIKLFNFFKNFEKVSAFGLDINFMSENEIAPVNYSPTLSSMEIFISDSQACEKLIKELKLLRLDKYEEGRFYDNDLSKSSNFEYHMNENIKIICYDEKIKIEFYETKPPHGRFILSNQLEQIFSKFNAFDSIEISKIEKCSWFCVLWSPFKSAKSQFSNTSFLVYYQFSYTDSEIFYQGYNNYLEIPIIGILPVKFDDNLWLSKISKIGNHNLTYSSNLDFKMALNDSVNNVHDFIFPNTDRTSTDYDFYLKNSM